MKPLLSSMPIMKLNINGLFPTATYVAAESGVILLVVTLTMLSALSTARIK